MLSDQDIGRYIPKYYAQPGQSRSYQNQAVNALKLFCRTEFGKEIGVSGSLRAKAEQKLPNVLSQDEERAIFSSFINSEHKTISVLIYSGGLRIGEVVSLTLTDIDSKRGIIRIRNSKGAKSRKMQRSIHLGTPMRHICLKTELIYA